MREGWEYKKLGEVCEIFGRIGFRGYKREDYVESEKEGAISLSPSNIISGRLDYSKNTYISWYKYEESPEIKIFEGDVLLVKTASVGKSAIVDTLPHAATINPQFVVFKNIQANNQYLFYSINSEGFLVQLKSITSGSSVPTLSQKALAELQIPLPPLPLQQSIVAELDEINNLLSLKRKELETYDKLAQSLFYEMFGDPVENEKGWEVKKLGEVCVIITGSTPSTSDGSNWDGHVNWVTPAELDIQLYYGETKRKITEKAAKSLIIMPKGTVLLSTRAPIGKLAITTVPMCCNQGFKNMICKDELVNIFLYYYLLFTMDNIKAMGRGATFKEVSKNAINEYSVVLPPLSLQQLFATRIEAIEAQKANVKTAIEKLETLLAARMQYWFE